VSAAIVRMVLLLKGPRVAELLLVIVAMVTKCGYHGIAMVTSVVPMV